MVSEWGMGRPTHFYSRPCGRGDTEAQEAVKKPILISTHAPAGGATVAFAMARTVQSPFLLTPLREGRPNDQKQYALMGYFYSRPCGRGD